MFLRFCDLGVTMAWDDGLLGARASRPHQAWHSLGHLPHLHQPGTAPWLSFGLADAVPAHRVAACSIALKLSGGQRDRMRAGRPRSQALPSRRCGRGCLAGDFSESRPAPFGKLPFARQPCPCPRTGRIIREDYCGLSRARTLSGEAGWRQNILSILFIHVNQGLTRARGRDQTPGT